jgi:hypothetical protein
LVPAFSCGAVSKFVPSQFAFGDRGEKKVPTAIRLPGRLVLVSSSQISSRM